MTDDTDVRSILLKPHEHSDTHPISVRLENMSFGYDEKLILENVNLEISEPGLLCILGPNGVGKTTIVKNMNKLLKPKSGHVYVNGVDVSTMSHLDVARIMAFVPNSSNSVFSMTVGEFILMGRHPRAGYTTSERDIAVVDSAIEILGLQEFAERDVRQLSAGQTQRVLIARGLVQEPEILILDEPTAALDPIAEYEIYKQFNTLVGGKSAFYISHRLSSCQFCDRIAVFSDGHVAEYGTHAELEKIDGGIYAQMFEAQAKYYKD